VKNKKDKVMDGFEEDYQDRLRLMNERLEHFNSYSDKEWKDMRRHFYNVDRDMWHRDLETFKHKVRLTVKLQMGFTIQQALH
jgi:hypothetical protein